MLLLFSSDQYLSVSFYRGYGTVYDGSPSRHPYLETPPNTIEALKGIGNHIMGLGHSHVSQY
jgi:hypothetical protein